MEGRGTEEVRTNDVSDRVRLGEVGSLSPDILGEKVMSAIVEIKVPVERTGDIVRLAWAWKSESALIALVVGTRCDEKGEENAVAPILDKLGYRPQRAKTNLGLGRVPAADGEQTRELVKA